MKYTPVFLGAVYEAHSGGLYQLTTMQLNDHVPHDSDMDRFYLQPMMSDRKMEEGWVYRGVFTGESNLHHYTWNDHRKTKSRFRLYSLDRPPLERAINVEQRRMRQVITTGRHEILIGQDLFDPPFSPDATYSFELTQGDKVQTYHGCMGELLITGDVIFDITNKAPIVSRSVKVDMS